MEMMGVESKVSAGKIIGYVGKVVSSVGESGVKCVNGYNGGFGLGFGDLGYRWNKWGFAGRIWGEIWYSF